MKWRLQGGARKEYRNASGVPVLEDDGTPVLGSLSVGNVLTDPTTITIPNDLVKGMNYSLGVIIDSDGAIAENDELNATFMPILIN